MFYYIDLFCGAGGVTSGLHMARDGNGHPVAEVIACVNHDPVAIASRLRYFGIFAKNHLPISFPPPTHSKKTVGKLFGDLKPWMPVRDVLDFDTPGESIFTRKKPLTEKTLERIYAGLMKHVAGGDTTFLSKYYSGNPDQKNISVDGPSGAMTTTDSHALVQAFMTQRQNDRAGQSFGLNRPARTVTTTGGNQELVQAFLVKYMGNSPVTGVNNGVSVNEPCVTVTTQNRLYLTQAEFLTRTNGGKAKDRVMSVNSPANALSTSDNKALVSPAFVSSYYGKGGNTGVDEVAPTVTCKDRLSLIEASFLDQQYGASVPSSVGLPAGTVTVNPKLNLVQTEGFIANPGWFGGSSDLSAPAPTIVARQDKSPLGIIQTDRFFSNYYTSGAVSSSIEEPSGTLVAIPKQRLIECEPFLLVNQFARPARSFDQPEPTLCTGNHHHVIEPETGDVFIQVFESDTPATLLIKRFMAAYGIIDIRMRMLKVIELKRIQGFPENYVLHGTQTDAKRFIGNAVVPQVVSRWVESLYQANFN